MVQERRLGSRYVLTEVLGQGAMGQVYRARVDADPARPGGTAAPDVAAKILRGDLAADPDLIQRFLQEGRLLKSVDHPNVVRIRDLVAEGDQLALVMDLVEDGDLRRAVPVPCAEAQAAQIVAGLAAGLAAVHAAGITHRDLKPENVLVERIPDGRARARIADFGVSRFGPAVTTGTKGMTGTVGYIAPEIAAGGVATPAGDVYALGVILYELCTGHGPFQADHPLAVVRAHADDPVPRPPYMTDPVWALVDVLLAKDPAARPTAAEVSRQLHGLAVALAPDEAAAPAGTFALAASPHPAARPTAGATLVPGTLVPGTAPSTLAAATLAGVRPVTSVDGAPSTAGTTLIAATPAIASAVSGPLPGTARQGGPGQGGPGQGGPGQGGTGGLPPLRPLPAPPGRTRRPRVAFWAAVAAGALLLAGGATWAAWSAFSTTSLGSDHTVAIGDGSAVADPTDLPGASGGTPGISGNAGGTAPADAGRGVASAAVTPPPHASSSTMPASPTATPGTRAPALANRPVPAVATTRAGSPPPAAGPAVVTTTTTERAADPAPVRVVTTTASSSSSAPEAAPDPRKGTVPLYRYVSGTTGDHFYTTNYAELGAGGKGYRSEGIAAYVYPSPVTGTVPLYRYWNGAIGDHFYTTNYAELGAGGGGYAAEGIGAYVYPSPVTGTVPLYRYVNGTSGDHFYTTNYAELGAGGKGYRSEGIAAYVR